MARRFADHKLLFIEFLADEGSRETIQPGDCVTTPRDYAQGSAREQIECLHDHSKPLSCHFQEVKFEDVHSKPLLNQTDFGHGDRQWGCYLRETIWRGDSHKRKFHKFRHHSGCIEERGQILRRRAGLEAYTKGKLCTPIVLLKLLLLLLLALWHIPTVCALDIQFPDMGSRLNCPCPICPCSDPLATGQGPSFVIVPQGPQVAMRFSGSYFSRESGQIVIKPGDAVTIMEGSKICDSSSDIDTAKEGVKMVIVQQSLSAVFDFSEVPARDGYLLCICPGQKVLNKKCPDDAASTAEVKFQVQDDFKGLEAYRGYVSASQVFPQQTCGTNCPLTHSFPVAYVNSNNDIEKLSIVATSKKCSVVLKKNENLRWEPADNPPTKGDTFSGHLDILQPPLRLIPSFDVISEMKLGVYKICFKLKDDIKDDLNPNQNWFESGVLISTQDAVSSLSINGIIEVEATVAKRAGNTISLCKNYDCTAKFGPPVSGSRVVSFIPAGGYCDSASYNPQTRPKDFPKDVLGASGHMKVDPLEGTLPLGATDTYITGSSPGLLMLCLKESDAWFNTGIFLEIQNAVLGLEVNGLAPRKWWRVEAPKASGTILQFSSSEALSKPGDTIALIRTDNECSALCKSRTKSSCQVPAIESEVSVSGFLSAHGTDRIVSSTECYNDQESPFPCIKRPDLRTVDFAVMPVGNYKACFRQSMKCVSSECWSEWQSTGIQLTVQDSLTAIDINGEGVIRNPGHGQRVVIPRRTYHTFTYFGSPSQGGKLQMLRRSDECSDFSIDSIGMPLANNFINVAAPDSTVRITGASVDNFLNMGVGQYQVCFLSKGSVQFLGTGVSITIQNYTDGLEVNGIRPNRGLRISVPKRKSNRLQFFSGKGMVIGDKITFIPLQFDCLDPTRNTDLPHDSFSSSGHMVVESLKLLGDSAYKVLSRSDAITSMAPNLYKVCYKSVSAPEKSILDTFFRETGLTVRIQDQLTFAIINARDPTSIINQWDSAPITPSNIGVRLTAPKANEILFLLRVPGSLSFIEADKDCTSTKDNGDNPEEYLRTPMYIRTQPYKDDYNLHAVLDFTLEVHALNRYDLNLVLGKQGVRKPDMYQVCYTRMKKEDFIATGISLRLQGNLRKAIVNSVSPNYGLRVAIPKSQMNVIQFEGTPMQQAQRVSRVYSFIQYGGDCSLASDNPVQQSDSTSGFLWADAVYPSDFSVPPGEANLIQNQAPGIYHLCYRELRVNRTVYNQQGGSLINQAHGSLFADTGISVLVQNHVARLQVNMIPKIQSVVPKVLKNEIYFCTDEECSNLQSSGTIPAFISFINPDSECEDLVNKNQPDAVYGRSGHILAKESLLSSDINGAFPSVDLCLDASGMLAVGMYQVCYGIASSAGANAEKRFTSTGLSLAVQEYLTRLSVNGIYPGLGLKVVVPKTTATLRLAHGGPEFGTYADRVSMIDIKLDCTNMSQNTILPNQVASGHFATDGTPKNLKGVDSVRNLEPGRYHVCFKGNSGSFKATGVSVQIQTWAYALMNSPEQAPSTLVTLVKSTNAMLSFVGKEMTTSTGLAPWPPTKASLITPFSSCSSSQGNPETSGVDRSGHMDVSISTVNGSESFKVNLPSTVAEPTTMSEMLFQLCVFIESNDVLSNWYSTGLAVQVDYYTASPKSTLSFDFASCQESNGLRGSFNAISVFMKTSELLPQGGILRIEGLTGSQTPDTPGFEVAGNSVKDRSLEMICAGNFSCQVTSGKMVQSGEMLMRAEMTIEVACTDFDSTCKLCPLKRADCSEVITSASIYSSDLVQDITSQISPGPWQKCLKQCSETRTIISGLDVLDFATKSGNPVTVSLKASDASNYFTCDFNGSPVTLRAKVTIRMLVSTLSVYTLGASFSSSTGRLTVPGIPFENSKYIHVTFIVQNSLTTSLPSVPSTAIYATSPFGFEVRRMSSSIYPRTKAGILMATQEAQFISAIMEMSSPYTQESNIVKVFVKSNWPAVFPKEVAITISGLEGSDTPDGSLSIFRPGQVELKTYECKGARNCLVDIDVQPSSEDHDFFRAKMDIDIFCTDFGAYPDKYIETISACSQMNAQVGCPPLNRYVIEDIYYSRGPWQDCSVCRNSTRTVMRDYDLSEILKRYGTKPDAMAQNQKTKFSLALNASNDVSDLKCYGSGTVQSVKAVVTVRIEYSDKLYANWDTDNGDFSLLVSPLISRCSSPTPLTCLPDISFFFELKNPRQSNGGPKKPKVSARGGGLRFDEIEFPPVFQIVGPRVLLNVIKSHIQEKSRIKGNILRQEGLNTISLSMTLDGKLPAGTIVTLSGLTGSLTSSISCDTVAQPRCGSNDCVFSPADEQCRKGIQLRGSAMGASVAAAWDQATGTLKFAVMKGFAQVDHLEFSFDILNAAAPQSAKYVTISGTGPNNVFEISPDRKAGAVLSSDLDGGFFRPSQPAVLSAVISENTKIEYETNTLVCEMILNVPLTAGTEIEISKLSNTQMPSKVQSGFTRTWHNDVLPNVEKIPITRLSGHRIRAQGQLTQEKMYHMPWLCRDDGWGVELDRFYGDGMSPFVCQNKRKDAGGEWTPECAFFYRKRWCTVQQQYSVVAFLDQCVMAEEPISFSFTVQNAPIPKNMKITPPALSLAGVSQAMSSSFSISKMSRVWDKTCTGLLSCSSSFVNDVRYLDRDRRLVPPFSELTSAKFSIQVACSSFSDPDQFLQRISMCNLPDCRVYGTTPPYEWDQNQNACCTAEAGACQPYVCADPVPIPPNRTSAFEAGPWEGCRGNCTKFAVVMDNYDLMPLLCGRQTPCANPMSFALFMSASGAVDQFACSGTAKRSIFLVAKVQLQIELSYSSAAFASEPGRIDSVKVFQSSDTLQAISRFHVVVDSFVTFPKDSEVILSGFKNSMTPNGAGTNFVISHPDCGVSSMVEESIRVPCNYQSDGVFKSWDQDSGELRITLLRTIASIGDNLQFAFILRNAMEKQKNRNKKEAYSIPQVTLRLGGPDGVKLGPKPADVGPPSGPPWTTGVFLSATESTIVEGKVFESTQVQGRLNRLTVSVRVNYHLFAGDNLMVHGLLNSGTISTAELPIFFHKSNKTRVFGNWTQEKGTLHTQLPNFYDPGEAITFSFELLNPNKLQSSTMLLEVPSATPAWYETIIDVISRDVFKASQDPDFIEATLKPEHEFPNKIANFNCAFTSAEDIPVGSTIVIAGLLGSETPSNLDFPIYNSSGYTIPAAAEWNRDAGVLSFDTMSPIQAGVSYRFSFQLQNPKVKGPKRIALLSVLYGTMRFAMRQVGAVFGSSDEVEFIDARIGVSSRLPSAPGTLTMILQVNMALKPFVNRFEVLGILELGAQKDNTAPSATDFESTNDGNKLLLTSKAAFSSNHVFTFQWTIANPAAGTPPPELKIALYEKLGSWNLMKSINLNSSVISPSLGGRIVFASIEESSQVQGAKNHLKVQMRLDFPLSYKTSITLTGLTGTSVAGTTLKLLGNPNVFSSEGTWVQSTGTLVFEMLNRTIIDEMKNILVEFDLVNPLSNSTTKETSVLIPAHANAGKKFGTMVLLAQSAPVIFSPLISESSGVSGVMNTISVTFSSNSDLSVDDKVTVRGLIEYPGEVEVFGAKFESYLKFNQTNEESGEEQVMWELVVVLTEDVPAFNAVTFRFKLRNPEKPQNAVIPSILGSRPSKLIAETKSEALVLAGSIKKEFTFTEINESTTVSSSANTLSIILRANCPLKGNAEITIKNLKGSQTPNDVSLPVSSRTDGKIHPSGSWKDGTIIVSVQGDSSEEVFQPFEDIEFSFALWNPANPQNGVVPIVSACTGTCIDPPSDIVETTLLSDTVQWHQGIKKWRGDQSPRTVVGSVLSGSQTKVWLTGFIKESSGIAGQDNSILIEMKSNTPLPVGSKITVAGLTGSAQPDDGAYQILGQNGTDTRPGVWTQVSGVVVFELIKEIPYVKGKGATLSFILALKNPPSRQDPVRPYVSLSATQSVRGSLSITWKLAPVKPEVKGVGNVCCLSADDTPRFTFATVRETSNVKAALNVLHFSFRTNVPMTYGTTVAIAGLKSAQTPPSDFLPLMNSTSLSARWTSEGLLTFQVDPVMYFCDCIDLCAQNSLAINVQLQNAATAQPESIVSISAERPDMKIGETLVMGSVLRAQADPGLFASVSESSKVSGEDNNITVRLMVNSDLDICYAKWLTPDFKWISRQKNLMITEVGGVRPNPATALQKLFDGFADSAVSIYQDHSQSKPVDIYFDFGEVFRLEAISVTPDSKASSALRMKFQFADNFSAPEIEWDGNTAAEMTLGVSSVPAVPKTSNRFNRFAQFWRIRIFNNVNSLLFPLTTTINEVKFYGCPDSETATITVSNLTSASRRVQLFNVQSGTGALRPYGYQTDDKLSVKVDIKSIRAFEEINFTFTTTNAPTAQPARLAGVSVRARLYAIASTFAYGSMLTSDESPAFITKTISEESELQSDSNTLTIKLRANILLSRGDNIRIIFAGQHVENNLDGDRSPASCQTGQNPCVRDNALFTDLPEPSQNTSWYTQTNVPSLGYTDEKPSLIVILQREVPKYEEFTFQIIVKNPSADQKAGLVPEVVATGIQQSKMVGSVMQAPRVGPSFTTRVIHHSSDMAGARNTITVTLQPGPGIALTAGTKISICGLRVTEEDPINSGASPKPKNFVSRNSTGFEIKKEYTITRTSSAYSPSPAYLGELVACVEFVILEGQWDSSAAWVSFEFKNPIILLPNAPEVTVSASEKITIKLPMCKEMNKVLTALCNVRSDALFTKRKFGFLDMKIHQDNRAVKQLTMITVTLIPNALMVKGTTLTLTGFKGWAGSFFELLGPVSHLMGMQQNYSTGQLRLEAQGNLNSLKSREVIFNLRVRNPSSTQADTDITACFQSVVPSEGLTDIGGVVARDVSDCLQPVVLGKLQVNEETNFVIKSISESTDVENQDNIITVTLSANFPMFLDTKVTISGLTGSQTMDKKNLVVRTFYDGKQQDGVAEWTRSSGLFVMTLKDTIRFTPSNVSFSFVLRNPRQQAAVSSRASAQLTVSNVGGSDFKFQPMLGTVLRALNTARFTSYKIEEQTRVINQKNMIKLSLTSNFGISKGGILTISGLLGRDEAEIEANREANQCSNGTSVNITFSLTPVRIFINNYPTDSTVNNVIVNFKSCTDYSQVDSIITVSIPAFFKSGADIIVEFSVINSKQKRAGCRPSVSYSGCRTQLAVDGALSCNGQDTENVCSGCDEFDMITVAGTSSSNLVLISGDAARVVNAIVAESNSVLSQLNTISVTLAMSVELAPQDTITITGFQDSQVNPDDEGKVLTGANAEAFGYHAGWELTLEKGELILTVARPIQINENLTFAFNITNAENEVSGKCKYGRNFCYGPGALNEGRACPKIGATCSGVCDGGKSQCSSDTLRGSCAQYTTQDLLDAKKLSAASELCVGGQCIAASNGYQCPSGSLVNATSNPKIDGLLIDSDVQKVRIVLFGRSVVLKGQDCVGEGATCKGRSVCTAPNENEDCTTHLQCTGPFDPSEPNTKENLVKRTGPQRCVREYKPRAFWVRVKAARSDLFEAQASGNVRGLTLPSSPEFTSRVLTETSNLAGARNVLTVSLKANFLLVPGGLVDTRITLIGLPLHKYGIDRKVTILTPNAQPTTIGGVSSWSPLNSVVTCSLSLDQILPTSYSDSLLSAVLNIDVECSKGSPLSCTGQNEFQANKDCLYIKRIGIGDGNETLASGSYNAAPCLDYPFSPCKSSMDGKWDCPIITNLDLTKKILASENPEISFRLHIDTLNPNVHTVRSTLTYMRTSEYGVYDRATQTLNISGQNAGSIQQDEETLIFSIPLENAATPQVAPSVTVIGTASGISGQIKGIGLCADEIQDGCSSINVPSTIRAITTGQVLTSASEGRMKYASIQETSSLQGSANVITVVLEAETDKREFTNIVAGSIITISGLTGSQTPSTDKLLVIGHRVGHYAKWNKAQGVLLVNVNAMPHVQTPSQIMFSFELQNPTAAQEARIPWVLVSGPTTSYGGKSCVLVCETRPGCRGVLAAEQRAEFVNFKALEKSRYVGEGNAFSVFLEANVPIQQSGTQITVTSLPPFASLPLSTTAKLTPSPGTVRRVEQCQGVHHCVLRQNQDPVPGTIITRVYTDMTVPCTQVVGGVEQDIAKLAIYAVRICGQLVRANYRNPCSSVVKTWDLLQAFPVELCSDSISMLIEIHGFGPIKVTSILNIDYVFDVSSRVIFENQALVLTVVANSSESSSVSQFSRHFAFSLNFTNPVHRSWPFAPTVQALWGVDTVVNTKPGNEYGGYLGASGVMKCNDVQSVVDGKTLPLQTAMNVNSQSEMIDTIYLDRTDDGVSECVFVIQPDNPNNFLLKLTFLQYDVDTTQGESVEVFNGDSPAAPRMGIIYNRNMMLAEYEGDSAYQDSAADLLVEECAVTLRFSLARGLLKAGEEQLLGYSTGRAGFSVGYKLVDPNKMDYFVARLGFGQMVDSVEDAGVQLKLRKVFASIMKNTYPSIIFEGETPFVSKSIIPTTEVSRRLTEIQIDLRETGVRTSRRLLSSQSYIRTLCNSPADAVLKADKFSEALEAGLVTNAMNVAGIPGTIRLLEPIKVFRCGYELECVPTVKPKPPPPQIVTPPPPPPPPPDYIEEITLLSAGVIAGPILACCCVLLYFNLQRLQRWIKTLKKHDPAAEEKKKAEKDAKKAEKEEEKAEKEEENVKKKKPIVKKKEGAEDGDGETLIEHDDGPETTREIVGKKRVEVTHFRKIRWVKRVDNGQETLGKKPTPNGSMPNGSVPNGSLSNGSLSSGSRAGSAAKGGVSSDFVLVGNDASNGTGHDSDDIETPSDDLDMYENSGAKRSTTGQDNAGGKHDDHVNVEIAV